MMKLASGLAILLLTVSLQGCGGGSDPAGGADGGTDGGDGTTQTFKTLTVTWAVKKADGTADTCPTNYPKLKVHASAADDTGGRNGDPFVTIFDCSAGTGSIQLPTSGDEPKKLNPDGTYNRTPPTKITGKYTVTAVITEASGETNYQAMESQKVDLASGDKSLSFVVTPNASPRVTCWRFYAKSTQETLSCAAAGVDQVRVKTKRVKALDYSDLPEAAQKEVEKTFACGNSPGEMGVCDNFVGGATSVPLEFGYYATSMEALANGVVVGTLAYDPNESFKKVDRETVRLRVGLGAADFSSVYFGETFTVFIDNR